MPSPRIRARRSGLDGRFLGVHGVGGRAVSGLGESFEEGVQAGGGGVELDFGAAEGEVDGGGGYARDRGEQAFDQPCAAGASHAFYGEGKGVGAAASMPIACLVVATAAAPKQRCLHLGHAPCVELRPVAGVGGGRASGVGVGAQAVPGIEPGVRDRLHRGAAGVAAYPRVPSRYQDAQRLEPEGGPAVVAAGWLPSLRGREDFRAQGFVLVRAGLRALSGRWRMSVL